MREERELTEEISRLCLAAIDDGVAMSKMHEWVLVLDRDGNARPVTRQAVDLMLSKLEGRPKSLSASASAVIKDHHPKASEQQKTASGVNLAAFG